MARAYQLLDMPNEVLLAVAAYVPYSGGESIITLRLINRQFRDVFLDRASLKQLRSQISEAQFPVAHALRTPTSDSHDQNWDLLRELEADTSKGPAIGHTTITKHADLQVKGTAQEDETQLLLLGLHMFAALSHLSIDVVSEKDVSHWVLSLGMPTIALLRFTSLKLVSHIRQLFDGTAEDAFNTTYQSLFSTTAAAALVDMIIEKGVASVVNLFGPRQNVSRDLLRFSKVFLVEINRIGLTLPYFMAHNEYERWKYTREFSPTHPVHIGNPASWGVVANNLLAKDIWTSAVPGWDGGCGYGFIGALFIFIYGKGASNDPEKIFQELDISEIVGPLYNYNWFDFVEQHMDECMARAHEQRESNNGVSTAVTEALHTAIAAAGNDKSEEAGVPRNPPPQFTYLCLKDYWQLKQL